MPAKAVTSNVTISTTYSVPGFTELCKTHVVDVVFYRRSSPTGNKVMRRMLCTLNSELLNSYFGKRTLKFRPPSKSAPYNAAAKGLVTVWDIFRQDWRNVPVKAAVVMQAPYTMPATPVKNFMEYFDKTIKPMTLGQRQQYIQAV
jgi:hypothetical protein